MPEADVALADQYQEAVTNHFPKGMAVKVAVRNQKGQPVLDIQGIPVAQVGTLIEALSAEIPPVCEMRLVEKAPTVS